MVIRYCQVPAGSARAVTGISISAQYLDKSCFNGFIRMDGSHYSCSLFPRLYSFPYTIDAEL